METLQMAITKEDRIKELERKIEELKNSTNVRNVRSKVFEGGYRQVCISLPANLVPYFRERGSRWVLAKLLEEVGDVKY